MKPKSADSVTVLQYFSRHHLYTTVHARNSWHLLDFKTRPRCFDPGSLNLIFKLSERLASGSLRAGYFFLLPLIGFGNLESQPSRTFYTQFGDIFDPPGEPCYAEFFRLKGFQGASETKNSKPTVRVWKSILG